MLLDTVFAPFVKERPICVMARGVLERLLDADWIGREGELQLLRRSSVIRVKIRPVELPAQP